MPTKLYVGNLAYAVTQEDLAELFAQAGKVESAVVVSDKFSGQSRGFGFVEMAEAADAATAISDSQRHRPEGPADQDRRGARQHRRPARRWRWRRRRSPSRAAVVAAARGRWRRRKSQPLVESRVAHRDLTRSSKLAARPERIAPAAPLCFPPRAIDRRGREPLPHVRSSAIVMRRNGTRPNPKLLDESDRMRKATLSIAAAAVALASFLAVAPTPSRADEPAPSLPERCATSPAS